MSRNGAGVYSLPPIYEATAGQTATATQHNTPLEDLEEDANIARPIVAGGTGASTAADAADNLSVLYFGGDQTLSDGEKAQARENIGLGTGPLAGFRNKIINGNFDVWQRGTSASGLTAGTTYSADRWRLAGSGATYGYSRQTHVLGQTDVPGNPKYFLRYAVTSADDNASLAQLIEGVTTLAGQTVTLTFYAKSSSAPTGLDIALIQNFGTGGSPSSTVSTTVSSGTVISSSWQKFQFVANLPSVSGKTLGTDGNDTLILNMVNPNNETWEIDLSHVSIVSGDATNEDDPFETLHISQVEAQCFRYFWGIIGNRRAYLGDGTGNACLEIDFPTRMRAPPTVTRTLSVGSGATDGAQDTYYRMVATTAGGAPNRRIEIDNISFDSEL